MGAVREIRIELSQSQLFDIAHHLRMAIVVYREQKETLVGVNGEYYYKLVKEYNRLIDDARSMSLKLEAQDYAMLYKEDDCDG